MKNIFLRYALPSSLMNNVGLDQVKLVLSSHNLFVLKTYTEDFDPQMQSFAGWYYPQTKSVTFGLNITI